MAESGTILVRVFTSKARIPIENATVVITQDDDSGGYKLSSVQTTDQNGHTVPISLGTPDRAESLAPSDITPYLNCSVWAEHPDYEVLIVRNVQIFSGTATIQDMSLIPIPEGELGTNVGTVSISPQDL